MDTRMPFKPDTQDMNPVAQWSEKYVDVESDIPRSKIRPLEWWYNLTAPPIPPNGGNLEERDAARRGRLNSTILLILLGMVLCLALPVVIMQKQYGAIGIMASGQIVTAITLFLNRRGKISVASWILIIDLLLGFWGIILNQAGLTANSVPLYDLLIIAELLAVSLLPPRSVFFIAFANSAFVILSLGFWKHTPSLDALLAFAGPEVYARPIALQFIVAFATYMWVRSTTRALQRADRAEVIAALEHQMAKQEHIIAQEKRQLEYSINQITETLMRTANGDFNARVPLNQENVLWPVAGSVNNLLSRLQRMRKLENEMVGMRQYVQHARQLEQELVHLKYETMRIAEMLHRAKKSRRPIPIQPMRSGTLLEPVIAELQGNTLFQSPDAKSDSLQATVSGGLQTTPAEPLSQWTEQRQPTISPPFPGDSRKHPHKRL